MTLSAIHDRFRVSCLPRAAEVAQEWRATHVISLLDPGIADEHVPVIRDAEHIVARLRDQENPDTTSHFPDLVESLFETVRPAVETRNSRILVHCHAGISRSTAFAYSMIAHSAGPGYEEQAFGAFLSIVNKPWPNRRIVEILDRRWGRDGALLKPLDDMRARFPKRIDALHKHNLRRRFFELVPCEIYNR
ncbi:dual specificity protein phosphatase family protein [Rhizobium sp. KVB221]|uniref:Dual specificity protein phosphatase family protein n=1 Tax=Rhizobium setariae TaxID=2801340 RepID=A0A936YNH9_9HYPH|nr:protein-tyrosine phosphatase family protein [Rhizobium setariae]MBL0371957.1 dual specificity protein phosphatase family protein [Rhizobium setariae]